MTLVQPAEDAWEGANAGHLANLAGQLANLARCDAVHPRVVSALARPATRLLHREVRDAGATFVRVPLAPRGVRDHLPVVRDRLPVVHDHLPVVHDHLPTGLRHVPNLANDVSTLATRGV